MVTLSTGQIAKKT